MKKVLSLLAALGAINLISAGAWALVLPPTPVPTPIRTPVPISGAPDAPFQVHYAANLNIGDSFLDYTNGGSAITGNSNGNICLNVYAFNADDTMAACCACLITPDALVSQSVRNDIIFNTLTPAVPNAVVIKLLASQPKNGNQCNASSPTMNTLAPGLVAWGTNLHENSSTTPVTYGLTESEFSYPTLSAGELSNLTSDCGFIQTVGAGFGICRSCRVGGQ